mmetsp:Transcript_21334/g.38722  ORF Transcript_21334/g.38722 Transcript_21334/m.38722 type:complete len:103 (+) Transcript_21334:112-420(+)
MKEKSKRIGQAPSVSVSSLLIDDQNDLSEPLLPPQEPQECILNQVDQPNEVPIRNIINLILGVTQLIASFPTGVLADHHRRDSMLKISSFVGFVAGKKATYG